MKKIQIARLATQLLFVALTVTALLMQLSVIKALIVLTTVLCGVFYCGWACPFGFIQDIGLRIGKKLGIKNRKIATSVHKVAVYMRYVLAIATLVFMSEFVMNLMGLEARGAFIGLISGRIPTVAALLSIVFFFVLSIKYDRMYCRYICPEGGRYGVMSLVRPFTIKRNDDVCVNCGKCDRACPMQIAISKADKLRSPQCVNCFECMGACPVDGAMEYGVVFARNSKKIEKNN